MIHLGDITKLRGDEIPPVDCITGGSPCQDLSVAGKRAGLAGERSGLFLEQIRIVKEMRNRDIRNGRTGIHVRPRFMVWENVPGAFSSNKGEDFRAVLEEIVKVVEPDAPDVPLPDKGKWPKAGCLYSDVGKWSVAWRVHDAQFWGVPQRRKRIALVADFGGLAAPEILFERESLSRDSEPSGAEREGTAAAAQGSSGGAGYGETGVGYWQNGIQTLRAEGENRPSRPSNVVVTAGVYCLQGNGIDRADTAGCNGRGWREDQSYTLNTIDRPAVFAFAQNQRDEVRDLRDVAGSIAAEPGMKQQTYVCAAFKAGNGSKANGIGYEEEKSPTLSAAESGRNTPLVYDARGNGNGETAPTMTGDHQSRVTDYTAVCVDAVQTYSNQAIGQYVENDKASSLKQRDYKDATDLIVAAVDCRNGTENPDVNGTLQAKSNGGFSYNCQTVCRTNQTVRRLTPLECERLQGFPDGWTDIGDWVDSKGKKHKAADSPRYKALGNSIALPFWFWLLRRISAQYERPATLGSLFDGIGGFPLCWERCNGKGTAIWASEIEEFPIAVTKAHFPEVGAT